MANTVLDLKETIARAKVQVLEDVKVGVVPATCASFSELHDYVDANYYGGAFERPFDSEDTDFWNAVQDSVDVWIKAGGLNAGPAMDLIQSERNGA